MPPNLLLALLAAVAVTGVCAVGVRLTYIGLRGDLIDRHPTCRTCKYDLTGHDIRPRLCPECSAHLHAPQAVRLGHRRVNGTRTMLGLAAMIGAIAPIAHIGVVECATTAPAAALITPGLPRATTPAILLRAPSSKAATTAMPTQPTVDRHTARSAGSLFSAPSDVSVTSSLPTSSDLDGRSSPDDRLLGWSGDPIGDTEELRRNVLATTSPQIRIPMPDAAIAGWRTPSQFVRSWDGSVLRPVRANEFRTTAPDLRRALGGKR